jgi:hypothetical protein
MCDINKVHRKFLDPNIWHQSRTNNFDGKKPLRKKIFIQNFFLKKSSVFSKWKFLQRQTCWNICKTPYKKIINVFFLWKNLKLFFSRYHLYQWSWWSKLWFNFVLCSPWKLLRKNFTYFFPPFFPQKFFFAEIGWWFFL